MFDLGRLEAPTVGSLMDCIRDDFMYMADSEHLAIAQDSRVVYIIYTYIYIIRLLRQLLCVIIGS